MARDHKAFCTMAMVLALSGVVGCGGGARDVRLGVFDAASGEPVTGARIRACPLDTNGVPLPVSMASLRESQRASSVSAVTDDSGEVTLPLYSRLPFLVEMVPWPEPGSSETGIPVPTWTVDPSDRSIRAHSETTSAFEMRVLGR